MTTSGPHLVVIGAPGAGKTRVGKRVARLLKVRFIDTDRRIVAAHGPIATIFAERGETWFRQVERAEVAKALSEVGVVSLGGGAVLDPATQEQLAHHRVAMLTVSAEAVEERIAGAKRPLLKNGIDAWLTLVESRREIYERLASRSWDTSDRPIDQIAAEIAEWVLEDSASKELQ
ncbi:MAG: shikimate kinase [Microbacteriaceae bacterium]|jgi:shikimate kinase|nr:shikimate kinase [Microbacteriaceae bacterium]MCU1505444.1 shikimate kinase [Microbacteriaceae bacterium]MCU1582462.1 shikimate kinase [Microbacteriaceae bacterium]MDQ1549323.1 shikimate kinase [Microbacteriaceae bacterium]MDQ1553196.1 shikimate kinase [Microbacteriaceae bacterium]